MDKRVGFVCFGEVNTPIERLQMKHDEALGVLTAMGYDLLDAGLVIDDEKYATADAAAEKLRGFDMCCLVVCVAGWVPTHAVIRVTDQYRHIPMLLWGLCGWKENGRIITTAEQAGTSAIRPTFEALGYDFKYVYNIIGKDYPRAKLDAFISACAARRALRDARVGTMGYRDMLLFGTQYEGNSMRGQLGVEVEPYEMLEMVRALDTLEPDKIAEGVKYVKETWKFEKPCDEAIIEKGVKYALAIGKKITERGWEAITLLDVDGMKKLEGFPPAMVFILLNTSLLCVSKVKTGYVTCARLAYMHGRYRMHVYTGEAKTPPAWNEYGWDDPAPQLPSLEIFPDSCTVEEFAQNVCCQHVIVAYGDYTEQLRDFCKLMDIDLVM